MTDKGLSPFYIVPARAIGLELGTASRHQTAVKITYKTLAGRLAKTDLLVVLAAKNKKPKLPEGVSVPPNAIASFGGEARETRLTDATRGPAKRVLFIGLGGDKIVAPEIVRRAAAIAVRKAEKTKAASLLGIKTSALYYKLDKYGLE